MNKQEAKDWIEQNAAIYSETCAFPVCQLAHDATALHVRTQDSDDYVEYVDAQFYAHAHRIFKQRGFDMKRDA